MKNRLAVSVIGVGVGWFVASGVSFMLGQAIRPDGVTKTTVEHLVDISACDTVKIEGRIDQLDIRGGRFSAYSFKKYGHDFVITCSMDSYPPPAASKKGGK